MRWSQWAADGARRGFGRGAVRDRDARGHLLRVGMAPVRGEAAGASLTGYVLLDDVTGEQEDRAQRDRLPPTGLTRRPGLGGGDPGGSRLQIPISGPASAKRFMPVLRDEAGAMAGQLDRLAAGPRSRRARAGSAGEMQGADLAAAARRIEASRPAGRHGFPGRGGPVAQRRQLIRRWLQSLAVQLVGDPGRSTGCSCVSLTRRRAGASSGLGWGRRDGSGGARPLTEGRAMAGPDRQTVRAWSGNAAASCGSAGPGGAAVLPASCRSPRRRRSRAPGGSRPEYYDFDLFAASAGSRALDGGAVGARLHGVRHRDDWARIRRAATESSDRGRCGS